MWFVCLCTCFLFDICASHCFGWFLFSFWTNKKKEVFFLLLLANTCQTASNASQANLIRLVYRIVGLWYFGILFIFLRWLFFSSAVWFGGAAISYLKSMIALFAINQIMKNQNSINKSKSVLYSLNVEAVWFSSVWGKDINKVISNISMVIVKNV